MEQKGQIILLANHTKEIYRYAAVKFFCVRIITDMYLFEFHNKS